MAQTPRVAVAVAVAAVMVPLAAAALASWVKGLAVTAVRQGVLDKVVLAVPAAVTGAITPAAYMAGVLAKLVLATHTPALKAQSASSGPVVRDHSHQQERQTSKL
jgi:hypothetical protein